MSKWGGELTWAEAMGLRAAGVRLCIVGTGNAHPGGAGEWARQQAKQWLDAGGEKLDAYVYLYMAGDPVAQVRQALDTLADLPVRRWWLDAEDVDSPELTPLARWQFLNKCETELLAAGKAVGIYTGRWWWVPNMLGYAMADLPLWNSWYDGDPDEDGLPYGGWQHSAIEQYQGTTVLAGQSVDLNYAKDLDSEDAVNEDLMLALFAGSEHNDGGNPPVPKSRDERLAYARGRVAEIAAGTAPSLVELAGAALAKANAKFPAHKHALVANTGGALEITA